MMSFGWGTGGGSREKAEYYAQPTMPNDVVARADYYLRGVSRGDLLHTAAVPSAAMGPEVATMLGLNPDRAATLDEVANLLAGLRADGEALPGNQRDAQYAKRLHTTYYDFTLSAPGSVSIAFALAPSEAERAVVLGAHEEAAAVAMKHLEGQIARVRRGHAGSHGSDQGRFGYVSFLHVSSRPTVAIAATDEKGAPATVLADVPDERPGDMNLHTHHIVPNAVLLPDDTVGSLDTLGLHEFVHEAGGVYQFTLAARLKAQGVDYGIDPRTELGHIPDVPRAFVDAMSKRSRNGETAAREFAKAAGQDWDRMDPDARQALLRRGVQGKGQRRTKSGEAWAEGAWRKQAADHGYEHRSVINPEKRGEVPMSREERARIGYEAALPMLERRFDKRAVLNASQARIVAARGLIASRAEGSEDIEAVTQMMRERGVTHEGKTTALVWAEVQDPAGASLADRRGAMRITTRAHLDQETEALSLIAAAAGDKRGTLRPEQVEAAVGRVTARDGINFTTEAGRAQRRIIDEIAGAGRFVAVVGGAGVGKSTLLRVPVEAWQAEGRTVYATALAWRQARPLTEAGIASENAMALDKLLHGARDGRIKLDRRSVVVVDELGQVGTRHQLALARLQAERGFTLVAVGDDEQGRPVTHGNPYALIRRAIGSARVPEITTTVRQRRIRDRETVALFRAGRGGEAVARLRDDGRAHLVPGGSEAAIQATADLWERLTRENADRPEFTISISAPTNAETRDISAAIRTHRRARGELGEDAPPLEAQDQAGLTYELRLAAGDRVRLFDLVRAPIAGKPGAPIFATNGSVVRIDTFTADGIVATNAAGHQANVPWDKLRDRETGRIRLTYGDAVSIDAIQSATSTAHIAAYPNGTTGVDSKRAYVAQSRSREETHLVVSDGAERAALAARRAINDERSVTEQEVFRQVGLNFSKRVDKELAVELLERAERFRVGTVRSFAAEMRQGEEKAAAGAAGAGAGAAQRRQETRETTAAADTLAAAVRARSEAVKRIAGPRWAEAQQAREARRSARPAASRPKREAKPAQRPAQPPTHKPVSAHQAEADFREALRRAGLRPGKTGVHMDGKPRYTEVEGSRSKRGFYVAHLDWGWPAGTIINHKTGVRIDWTAAREGKPLTPEEEQSERKRQAAWAAQQEAAKAQRTADELRAAEKVAGAAKVLWDGARPARADHPYLARKGVGAEGWRVGVRGQTVTIRTDDGYTRRQSIAGALLIPMQDADGRLWGVQTITADGTKLYTGGMKGGRKQGTFAVLGELRQGQPFAIVEGGATGRTVHEATRLPVVIAWDSSNLMPVAQALRARDPVASMIFPGDNDHHLPRRDPPLPNVGVEKATAAAEAVGGLTMFPSFVAGDKGTDWNDFASQHGLAATRELIKAFLKEKGITMPDIAKTTPAAQPTATTQAQRDVARKATSTTPQQSPDTNAQAAQQANQRQQQTQGRDVAPGL